MAKLNASITGFLGATQKVPLEVFLSAPSTWILDEIILFPSIIVSQPIGTVEHLEHLSLLQTRVPTMNES